MNFRLLIVDDDEGYCHVLARALARRGFEVYDAFTPEQAINQAKEIPAPHYIVLDLNLNGQSGLNLIPPLLDISPDARILVLTGYASISTAVEAVKLGALDYLAKPASVEDIVNRLNGEKGKVSRDNPAQFMSVQRMEWEYIQRALEEHDGNITATARALKMHRRTLQRKLVKRPPAK
jgi:two-component system response regulator RegA